MTSDPRASSDQHVQVRQVHDLTRAGHTKHNAIRGLEALTNLKSISYNSCEYAIKIANELDTVSVGLTQKNLSKSAHGMVLEPFTYWANPQCLMRDLKRSSG